ncbi:hypothetical protein V2I01_06255 [Micromonospora sp. BRA006-A]|nr:hypothetical protein [Micromonospora sp. BRA006-A]
MIWEPSVVHEAGERRQDRAAAEPAQRAGVLDAAGQPIVAPRPVVRVQLVPGEIDDVPGLLRKLDAAFKAIRPALTPPVDLGDLPKRLKEAKARARRGGDAARRGVARQIKPRIYDLPGTRFVSGAAHAGADPRVRPGPLGSVDQATADDLQAHPERYARGDLVGHGGLQGRYDERLRGVPGVTVITERTTPDGKVEPTGTSCTAPTRSPVSR